MAALVYLVLFTFSSHIPEPVSIIKLHSHVMPNLPPFLDKVIITTHIAHLPMLATRTSAIFPHPHNAKLS